MRTKKGMVNVPIRTFTVETQETGRCEYGAWYEQLVNGKPEPASSTLRGLPDGDYVILAAKGVK